MTTTTARPAISGQPGSPAPRPRPGDPAARTAIDTACRALRLPTIRARVEDMIAAAEREQLDYAGFLAEALLAECDDRDERRRIRRVHDAGFPRTKRLEDFDYTANAEVNPATIATLATAGWVTTGSPVCLIGDSGTGKSHLLIGLGIAARSRSPGALRAGLPPGQRARRGRQRPHPVQGHRPLRPGRPVLPRRTGLPRP